MGPVEKIRTLLATAFFAKSVFMRQRKQERTSVLQSVLFLIDVSSIEIEILRFDNSVIR